MKGLSEEIKDELAARDETTCLEELIGLATHLDYRRRERAGRQRVQIPFPSTREQCCCFFSTFILKPGRAHAVWTHAANSNGAPTSSSSELMHLLRPGGPLPRPLSIIAKRTSSSAEGGALLSQTCIPLDPSKFVQMEGVLQWLHDTLPLQILIDCGADDDFIDANIAAQANIPVMELP